MGSFFGILTKIHTVVDSTDYYLYILFIQFQYSVISSYYMNTNKKHIC